MSIPFHIPFLKDLPLQMQHGVHLALIIGLSLILAVLLSRVILPVIHSIFNKSGNRWVKLLFSKAVERQLTLLGTLFFSYFLSDRLFPLPASWQAILHPMFQLVLLLTFIWLAFTVTGLMERFLLRLPFATNVPLRAFFQVAKILLIIIAIVVTISILSDESPTLVIGGFGAMAGVLMLIFKDAILGFIAGIQLSVNKMLSVGDWLEMPKYNADGDVIDISLTTVKVSNWDKTISTIPTYALISDSFKNWRGMVESGGRRIKRSVVIDLSTVHFLSIKEIEHLRKMSLISSYIDEKLEEIKEHNQNLQLPIDSPIGNGRHLTNIGTFRAYITRYLENHPHIHKSLICMVRQLEADPQGVPLEIYCFVNDTRWVFYEEVQADIFDHILAVIGEFNLRAYQAPSGENIERATRQLSSSTRKEEGIKG